MPTFKVSENNIADIDVPYLPLHVPTGRVTPLHPALTLQGLVGAATLER